MAATAMKHSRQRDAVLAYLHSTTSHPTAEMVYEEVRKAYPKISLGTVYRNLTLLVELGEVKKVATVDGNDRFDGNVMPHYHLICQKCHRVFDLPMVEDTTLNQRAQQVFNGHVEGHEVNFYGTCSQCL